MSNKDKKLDNELLQRAVVTDRELVTLFPFIQENRVLIKRDTIAEKTKSGLYIPPGTREEKEETTMKGTIVVVGPMVDDRFAVTPPHQMFNGQLVPKNRLAFGKYAGTEFWWQDQEYLFIRYDEIFAVWSPEIEDQTFEEPKDEKN